MIPLINRRKALALFGSITAFGPGTGTAAGDRSPSVTTVSVDASNLRGYWASNRHDGSRED
ncbi:MAG: hypothetical protein ABEJ81_03725 [Haloferacaceae archaeon]